ncbi:MAG: GNAT family N-acetyltransferase [Planctomycetota bacterium]
MEIEQLQTEDVRPLRYAVLRSNQPFEETLYPGDNSAVHLGIREGSKVIGVVSIYAEQPMPKKGKPGDFRFRGMAIDPKFQGSGVGTALIESMLDKAWEMGAQRIWGNTRTDVFGFYSGHGFDSVGDVFDIPDLGPHVVMFMDRPRNRS